MIATCAAKLWIHGYTGKARCRRCASQNAAGTKQTLDQNLGFQVTSRGQVGFDRPKCVPIYWAQMPFPSASAVKFTLTRAAFALRGQGPRSSENPTWQTAVNRGQAAVKRNLCLLPPLLLERRAFRAALAATVATSIAARRQRPASPRLPFLLESWTKIFTKHVFSLAFYPFFTSSATFCTKT